MSFITYSYPTLCQTHCFTL